MEALTIALFVIILGCVVDLERRVGSIDATVKRLEKNKASQANNPRPRKARSRGSDTNKNGG